MFHYRVQNKGDAGSEQEYQREVALATNYWMNFQSLNFSFLFIVETRNIWQLNNELEQEEFNEFLEMIECQQESESDVIRNSLKQYHEKQTVSMPRSDLNEAQRRKEELKSQLTPEEKEIISNHIDATLKVLDKRMNVSVTQIKVLKKKKQRLEQSFQRENQALQIAGKQLNQEILKNNGQNQELMTGLMSIVSNHEKDMLFKLHKHHIINGDLRLRRSLMRLDQEERNFLVDYKEKISSGEVQKTKDEVLQDLHEFRVNMLQRREKLVQDHLDAKSKVKGNMQQDMIRLQIYQQDRQDMMSGELLFEANDSLDDPVPDISAKLRKRSKSRFQEAVTRLEKAKKAEKLQHLQEQINRSQDEAPVDEVVVDPDAPMAPPMTSLPEVVTEVVGNQRRERLNQDIVDLALKKASIAVDVAEQVVGADIDSTKERFEVTQGYHQQGQMTDSAFVDACTGLTASIGASMASKLNQEQQARRTTLFK